MIARELSLFFSFLTKTAAHQAGEGTARRLPDRLCRLAQLLEGLPHKGQAPQGAPGFNRCPVHGRRLLQPLVRLHPIRDGICILLLHCTRPDAVVMRGA